MKGAAVAFWGGLLGAAIAPPARALEPITIGLFLPSKEPAASTAREVRAGAERAVSRANEEGGILGRPLRLIPVASDLSWDRAARELVDLIYARQAVAVVGALDSRSGHLAAQIITRARGEAVFLTPWASEDSLTQIRIPWFFRLVPDDATQAEALAREIFSARRIRGVALLVGPAADARAAARAFVRAAPPGGVAEFGAGERIDPLLAGVRRGDFGAVLLYVPAREARELASRIRSVNGEVLLAGPLWLNEASFVREGGGAEGAVLVSPCQSIEGDGPWSPPALYGHDAVRAVVEAMRLAGPPLDARRLALALPQLRAAGLSGALQFDGRGQRRDPACLAVTNGGRLDLLDPRAAARARSRR